MLVNMQAWMGVWRDAISSPAPAAIAGLRHFSACLVSSDENCEKGAKNTRSTGTRRLPSTLKRRSFRGARVGGLVLFLWWWCKNGGPGYMSCQEVQYLYTADALLM